MICACELCANARRLQSRAPALHRQPLQPVIVDADGCTRFRENGIVRYLLDHGPHDMNRIAILPFHQADREQFAQLIGYSVGGFLELSYVSDEVAMQAQQWSRAALAAARLRGVE